METEEKKFIQTSPDATSEEKVNFWAKAGRRRRRQERIEYENAHYDRLAIYGNILDD